VVQRKKVEPANTRKQEKTMTTTMAVEGIQLTLAELLDSLTPGEEVILTRNQQPVAKLVSAAAIPQTKSRPGPGLCKGMITSMAPDFDAPLEDLKEYME
jgi:antitoxin (DNA-binding transcriptional repressor) of toxin-antitoxin stability system